MTIYAAGVDTTLVRGDEAEHQPARKFLTERGALIAPLADGRKQSSEYVYLESQG
jgi:hypothetical protein